jgi:hypothetical protein
MSDVLTWAALLGKWTEFARSALALPRTAEGDRWRRAVPSIVGLQAVTHALSEIGVLPADECAAALDRAEVLIDRHSAELQRNWPREPLHPELRSLTTDAANALTAARERRALTGTR